MNALRVAPPLTVAVLLVPIMAGVAGTLLPALGYLPALGGTRLTLAWFVDLAARPAILRSAWLSFAVALAATGSTVLIVLLFLAGWAGTRTFTRVQHLLSPLLAVPHAAVAFGLAFLVAPSGFLVRLMSPWLTGFDRPPDVLVPGDPYGITMVAGLLVKEMPFLLLVAIAALPQLRLAQSDRIARSLGYGRVAGFAYCVAPALYGQLRLAVYAVLAYSSSVVDVARILGPGLPPPLAVRLLQWMSNPDLQLRFTACAGALLQFAVTGLAIAAWWIVECAAGHLVRSLRDRGVRFRNDGIVRRFGLVLAFLCGFTVFSGLGVLVLWSVAGLWQFPSALPDALTTRTWMHALPRIGGPLVTTLVVAATSAGLALLFAVACLQNEVESGERAGRSSMLLLYLPLLIPQISFVFGLQVLTVALGIDTALSALVAVHLLFVLPYVFLSLSDPWRALDRGYERVAAGLGRGRMEIFLLIRLPMLVRTLLTAFAVGFAVSVGLYLPTVLVGAGRFPTITTEAVSLASGENGRIIGVYAALQVALPFLAFSIASLVPALLFRKRRALAV